MEQLSEKIMALRIATRHACRCEQPDGGKKTTLSLKSKMLFCIRNKPASPAELMSKMLIGKTNLAIMARQLAEDGMIVRNVSKQDRRSAMFSITEKGKKHIDTLLNFIEGTFSKIVTTEEEYRQAIENIDSVLALLSFIG